MPGSTLFFNTDIPRTIPFSLKLRIFFKNPLALAGILSLLFGSVFPIVFGSLTDFQSTFVFKDSDPITTGVITSINRTNSSVNNQSVYAYGFSFEINGTTYEGQAFSTHPYSVSAPVPVQYKVDESSISKIQGTGTAPFSIWIFFSSLVFPLSGFFLIVLSVRKARKHIYLVEKGTLTTGRVTRQKRTMSKINNQRVYKVFFEFALSDGTIQEAHVKTHRTDQLGDEAKEPLVYDLLNPSSAVLLDALPKAVRDQLFPELPY